MVELTRKYGTLFMFGLATASFVLIGMWQNSQPVRVAESEALTSIEGIETNPETQSNRPAIPGSASPVHGAITTKPTALENDLQGSEGKQAYSERPFAEHANAETAENEFSNSKKKTRFALPSWEKIFNSDGRFRDEFGKNGSMGRNGIPDFVDLYDGVHASFDEEILSNGVALDISALLNSDKLEEQILYNGPVNPAHDLGFAWFLVTSSPQDGIRVFSAVERLFTAENTYIEFEFNQIPARLGSGSPWWQVQGERTDGDILVRMNFNGSALESVEVTEWQFNSFQLVQEFPGLGSGGCLERSVLIYCVGPQKMNRPMQEVWDENFNPVVATRPDQLIELGINIREWARIDLEIRGIVIRTPEDIVMNPFRRIVRNIPGFGVQSENRILN